MTIEIQELVIQARVVDAASQGSAHGGSWASLGRMEQNRLGEQITQQVLERLRDEREQR